MPGTTKETKDNVEKDIHGRRRCEGRPCLRPVASRHNSGGGVAACLGKVSAIADVADTGADPLFQEVMRLHWEKPDAEIQARY
ncbi:hypothetical protein ACOJBO_08265 [Rhizobium beringeri]